MLDVAAFLLLVSAAVGTLSLPVTTGAPPTDRAAATADALATGTTSVEYRLTVPGMSAPPAGRAEAVDVRLLDRGETAVARVDVRADAAVTRAVGGDETGRGVAAGERHRVAHGSYAGLLAEAAVENATLDGAPLSNASDGFERRVATAVANATAATGGRVHVRAIWTPYRGAPVEGVAAAGRQPPSGAAVAAATCRVPSRFPDSRDRALRAAATDGYAGVARVLATATVRGWFPPDEARLALRGEYPVDTLLARRYLRTAALVDANVTRPVAAVRPRRANRRLATALATRLERDLRDRFDSPAAAARAVRVGEVRVVVRTW